MTFISTGQPVDLTDYNNNLPNTVAAASIDLDRL